MQRPLNRIAPKMAPQHYQTYTISTPIETHWRPSTCQEVDCPHMISGWVTTVDESDEELGQKQAHYVRKQSGRSFRENRTPEGLTEFHFAPGQKCFREHKAKLDRPEFFLKAGGDWRASYDRRTMRPMDWLEDFGEHQQGLSDQIQRG